MDIKKNRIRDLREDLDLRQSDIAKAAGIDQKTLSNYETGKTNPDSYALIKLADFFQVTIDYLLGYSSSNIKSDKDIADRLDKIEKEINEIKRLISKQTKCTYIFMLIKNSGFAGSMRKGLKKVPKADKDLSY